MVAFKSWNAYNQFSESVLRKNRYILDSDSQEFLETLHSTSKSRVSMVPKGAWLYRSQVGFSIETLEEEGYQIEAEIAFPVKRMLPRENFAKEGRANSKGIPVLYVSNDRNTALAEVRPWLGSLISVAAMRATRKLMLVNFSSEVGGFVFYFEEPEDEKKETAVWRNIDYAFSKPVTHTEDEADYAPTQVISEFFNSKGFDGIAYRSSVGDGYNIALFDVKSINIEYCTLHEPRKIKFDFMQTGNPYFRNDIENGT